MTESAPFTAPIQHGRAAILRRPRLFAGILAAVLAIALAAAFWPRRPKPPTSDSAIVYVTKTGKKYHLGDCSALAKSRIPIKLGDAKARGRQPCALCCGG